MDRYIKRFFILVSVISCLQLQASCSEKNKPALKLGTVVWVGYEPLYLAKEKSFINNDEVQLVEFLSASQVMRGFRNQLIDIAALTMDEVMVLVGNGLDVSVILVMDYSNGADAIISQKRYKSFKEIKGKKVGYENTAVGAYLLSRALKINDYTSKDIQLITMRVNETEDALQEKSVDAVVTFEPIRSRLLEAGYNEIFSSRETPNEIVDVLVVRKELLKSQKKQLLSLVEGWFNSVAYFKENTEESLEIMNERLKLPETVLKQAFDGVSYPTREQNLLLLGDNQSEAKLALSSQSLLQEMINNKLIDSEVDIEVKTMFDSRLLRN